MEICVIILLFCAISCFCESPPLSFNRQQVWTYMTVEDNKLYISFPVNAFPSPTYSYYENETLIKEDSPDSYYFPSIKRNKAGIYRCVAKNNVGSLRSPPIFVNVIYFDKISEAEQTFVKNGQRGSYIILKIPSDVKAYPAVSRTEWFQNAQQVGPSLHVHQSYKGDLVFLDLQMSDSNKLYRARLSNGYNPTIMNTPTYNIIISDNTETGRLNPVKITEPSDVIIKLEESKPAIFECLFNARPLSDLRIRWYRSPTKEGVMVEINNSRYTTNAFNRTLTINSVVAEDAGYYKCEGTLDVSVSSRLAQLKVWSLPKVTTREQGSEISIEQGSSRSLPCAASGFPEPTIVWFQNAVAIGDSHPRLKKDNSNALSITTILPEDAGVYQCFVKNKAGESFYTIWIKVFSAAPKFIQRPLNTTKFIGEELKFPCIVNGAPKPSIQWDKSGVIITASTNRSHVDPSGSLIITPVRLSDQGLYKCTASNPVGSISETARLTVYKRTQIFPRPDRLTKAILTTPLNIPCGVDHDSRIEVTRQWWRRKTNTNFVLITTHPTDSEGTLKIRLIVSEDQGIYQCRAISKAGNDTAETEVRVVEPPRKPERVSASLNSSSSGIQDSVRLTWSPPSFDGNSPLTKFSIYQSLNQPDLAPQWKTVGQVSGTIYKFVVTKSLVSSKTYIFAVSAKNDIGESPKSVATSPVTMPQQPPSEPPQDVSASGSSNSTITVLWSLPDEDARNGEILGFIVAYKLYGLPDSNAQYKNITKPRTTQIKITGLPYWRKFQVKVAAYNAAGLGNYSKEKSSTTLEARPTESPEGVVVQPMSSTELKITFKPISPSSVNGVNLGYKIYLKCLSPVNCPNVLATVSLDSIGEGSVFEKKVGSLRKFARYLINIVCFTVAGDGDKSQSVISETFEDTPGPVASLGFRDISGGNVLVYWTAPNEFNGNLTGFQLSYSELNVTGSQQILRISPTVLEVQIQNLLHSTWYLFSLVASTSKGAGPPRTQQLLSGVPARIPTPPPRIVMKDVKSRSVVLDFIPGDPGRTSISRWVVEGRRLPKGSPPSTCPLPPNLPWNSSLYSVHAPQSRSLLVDTLRPNSLYQLRIVAVNSAGSSEPSSPTDCFETGLSYPEVAPRGVLLRVISADSMDIFWQPFPVDQWNAPPIGFRVLYTALAEDGSVQPAQQVNFTSPSAYTFRLTGLRPATRYSVRLLAYNRKGAGDPSNPVKGTTLQTLPGDAPVQLRTMEATNSGCKLSWGPVMETKRNGNILGYWIYYKTNQDPEWQSLQIQSKDKLSWTLTGLQSYTLYLIRIAAYNIIGIGPRSSSVTETTTESTPGYPVRVRSPSITSTSALVSWSTPSPPGGQITNYGLLYIQKNSSQHETVTVGLNVLHHNITGLVPRATYTVSVWAVTKIGNGAVASIEINLDRNHNVPGTPDLPTVLSGSATSSALTIAWSMSNQLASTGKVRYFTVQMRDTTANQNNEWTQFKKDPTRGEENKYPITGLRPFTSYVFRVAAVNDIGSGNYSLPSKAARTLEGAPSQPPTTVAVSKINTTAVAITWKDIPQSAWNGPAPSYQVFHRSPDSDWTLAAQTPAFSTSRAIVHPLKSGVYLIFAVLAKNTRESGPLSSPSEVLLVGDLPPIAAPRGLDCVIFEVTRVRCRWSLPSNTRQTDFLGYTISYTNMGLLTTSRARRSTHDSTNTTDVIAPSTGQERVSSSLQVATLDSLQLFSRYRLQIQAFNPAGSGPLSSVFTLETGEGVPEAPVNLRVTVMTTRQVEIAWEAPNRPNGIIINYSVELGKSNFSHLYEKSLASDRLQFTDSSLTPNILYYVKVTARTTTGLGRPALIEIPTYPLPGSPAAPTGIRAATTASGVDMVWSLPLQSGPKAPVTAVFVEAYTEDSTGWTLVAYLKKDLFSHLVDYTLLRANSKYRFRVTAVNRVWMGPPSAASEEVNIPDYTVGPFYHQWWFLVIVALVAIIIIILTISILAITGRQRQQMKAKKRAYAMENTTSQHPLLIKDNQAGIYVTDDEFMDARSSQPQTFSSIHSFSGDNTLASSRGGDTNPRRKHNGGFPLASQHRPAFPGVREDDEFSKRPISNSDDGSNSYLDDDFDDSDDDNYSVKGPGPPPPFKPSTISPTQPGIRGVAGGPLPSNQQHQPYRRQPPPSFSNPNSITSQAPSNSRQINPSNLHYPLTNQQEYLPSANQRRVNEPTSFQMQDTAADSHNLPDLRVGRARSRAPIQNLDCTSIV